MSSSFFQDRNRTRGRKEMQTNFIFSQRQHRKWHGQKKIKQIIQTFLSFLHWKNPNVELFVLSPSPHTHMVFNSSTLQEILGHSPGEHAQTSGHQQCTKSNEKAALNTAKTQTHTETAIVGGFCSRMSSPQIPGGPGTQSEYHQLKPIKCAHCPEVTRGAETSDRKGIWCAAQSLFSCPN